MNGYTPKYDDMSEEDFYLGFMLIVKERMPSLAEAISNDEMSEQTKQALDVALSFYDTSLQLAREINELEDKIRRLTHCLLLEGLSKPYSLHEEMDVTIGGFDGILPFGREIERYVMEGNLFSILTCCHARYRETVEHTLDDLLEGRMEK